jgi:hypothetical protein
VTNDAIPCRVFVGESMPGEEETSSRNQGETKRDRFVRLAERRTNAVIYKIRVLANCSNPYVYEYSNQDIERIFTAIEHELAVARSKFAGPRPAFTLTDSLRQRGGEAATGE